MVPFEEQNTRAYRLLLRIEIALREIIARAYYTEFGHLWRRRIPGELLKQIRKDESDELRRRHLDFRRLGPLYYLTFAQLIPILRQRVCAAALAPMGGNSFIAQVENLCAPRNAICHARAVPGAAMAAIEAVYAQLEAACSRTSLTEMLGSPDIGLASEDVRSQCVTWIHRIRSDVGQLATPLHPLPDHEVAVTQYWWGQPELAGFDTSVVDRIAELVVKYNALPIGVGTAAARNRFVAERQFVDVLDAALQELDSNGGDHGSR